MQKAFRLITKGVRFQNLKAVLGFEKFFKGFSGFKAHRGRVGGQSGQAERCGGKRIPPPPLIRPRPPARPARSPAT
eukprot:1193257-Prorocentrum_minimum.AAC.12